MSAGGYGSLLSREDITPHGSTMILVCRSGLAGSANAPAARSGVGRRLGRQRQKLTPPDTLAVRGVETAGDDEYSAGHGPDIRQFAEDQEAEDTDPQQLSIRKRREHGGVGVTEGEHDDPLSRGRRNTDENTEQNIVPARGNPDERNQRRDNANAHDRRIGHGGDGVFPSAHHPRHDQGAGPGQRGDDRQKSRGMKRAGTRPQDNQHAKQPDRGRKPAAHADAFAEKNNRQRRDEQWRDETGSGRFRYGQKPQAGDEKQRRRQQRDAAQYLQTGAIGSQGVQWRTRQHRRRHDQREHQKSNPGDLNRRKRCR